MAGHGGLLSIFTVYTGFVSLFSMVFTLAKSGKWLDNHANKLGWMALNRHLYTAGL
jgi:hypothetical protein